MVNSCKGCVHPRIFNFIRNHKSFNLQLKILLSKILCSRDLNDYGLIKSIVSSGRNDIKKYYLLFTSHKDFVQTLIRALDSFQITILHSDPIFSNHIICSDESMVLLIYPGALDYEEFYYGAEPSPEVKLFDKSEFSHINGNRLDNNFTFSLNDARSYTIIKQLYSPSTSYQRQQEIPSSSTSSRHQVQLSSSSTSSRHQVQLSSSSTSSRHQVQLSSSSTSTFQTGNIYVYLPSRGNAPTVEAATTPIHSSPTVNIDDEPPVLEPEIPVQQPTSSPPSIHPTPTIDIEEPPLLQREINVEQPMSWSSTSPPASPASEVEVLQSTGSVETHNISSTSEPTVTSIRPSSSTSSCLQLPSAVEELSYVKRAREHINKKRRLHPDLSVAMHTDNIILTSRRSNRK